MAIHCANTIQQDIRHVARASVTQDPQRLQYLMLGNCLCFVSTLAGPSRQGQASSKVLRWRALADSVPILIPNVSDGSSHVSAI